MNATEQRWVAVQTNQGTWVRRADGAEDPMRHVNVAQVYAPPSGETQSATLEASIRMSEYAALQAATLMASAPELAVMLRKVCETHWNDMGEMRAAIREAESLLAKVGG